MRSKKQAKTPMKLQKAGQKACDDVQSSTCVGSSLAQVFLAAVFACLLYAFHTRGGIPLDGPPHPRVSTRNKNGTKVAGQPMYHPDVQRYTKRTVRAVDPVFIEAGLTGQVVRIIHELIQVPLDANIHFDTAIRYHQTHLGLVNDYEYCLKSDVYKLQHPESIEDNYYILQDFSPDELPRALAEDFGVNVLPDIHGRMPRRSAAQRKFDIPLETALINTRSSRFHHFHPFGSCLFCTFQSSNHIPGKWSITGKDLVADNYRHYVEQRNFRDRDQCLATAQFMPISYRLYDPNECRAFFHHLNSEEYKAVAAKDTIGFIMKQGRDVHRGQGIELLSPELERRYRTDYGNGSACGRMQDNVLVAQRYIANPMLYKGHKIEVRIFFYVASTDPLIVYVQNLALLRKCGLPYNLQSTQKEVHVCNMALSKKVSEDAVVEFPLEGLHEYLTKEGGINNPRWLEETIFPQIYRAVTHLVRMGEHDFLVDSRVNENFALDLLIDDNSKVWFMENNPNPQVLRTSEGRVRRNYRMFGDLLEIQSKYLRSRFRRLRALAIDMQEDLQAGTFDKAKYQTLVQQANKNFLECDLQISEANTYVKVYDGNLEGVARFMGNLPEGCLSESQGPREEL